MQANLDGKLNEQAIQLNNSKTHQPVRLYLNMSMMPILTSILIILTKFVFYYSQHMHCAGIIGSGLSSAV